ncbi:MAG: ParB N-terminal domain-containing protein [Candidatus Methanomethylicia archaeon]
MSCGWHLSIFGFDVELSLASASSLYIHEEIIPSLLDKLVRDIKIDGVFKDPIIVDLNSMVVLDGMHRVAASRKLGLKWVPVCYLNYMDNKVHVHSWWRCISGSNLREFVEGNFKVEFLGRDRFNEYVSQSPLLVFRDGFHIFNFNDVFEGFKHVKFLEETFSDAGFTIDYDVESDAISKLDSGLCSAVLTLPYISKDYIVSLALSNKVLPHKSTRHVLPYRPMNVNVPLSILLIDDFKSAVSRFISIINSRKASLYPPGHVLDRRYDEYLYVFEG